MTLESAGILDRLIAADKRKRKAVAKKMAEKQKRKPPVRTPTVKPMMYRKRVRKWKTFNFRGVEYARFVSGGLPGLGKRR